MLPEHETTARELLGSVDFIGAANYELYEQHSDAYDLLSDRARVERLRGNEEAARQVEAFRDNTRAGYIHTLRDVAKLLDTE